MKQYIFILTLLAAVLGQQEILEGKCGCCPDPCCCVCVTTEEIPGKECPTTTSTTSTTTTTTTSTTTTSTTTTTEFIPTCNSTLDVSVILDSSGSVGETNWKIALQFVRTIVDVFDNIGKDGTRFSMITYSKNVTVNFDLCSEETNKGKQFLLDSINDQNIPLIGGITNTPGALEVAADEVFVRPCDRKGTPNIVVVLTDGRANVRKFELADIAKKLQAKVDCVIAIGVTDAIDMNELQMIAKCGDMEAVFSVNDFAELQTILVGLVLTVCEDAPTRPPRTTTTKAPRTTKERTTRGPKPTLPPCTPQPPSFKEECFCCCPPPPFGGYGQFKSCGC